MPTDFPDREPQPLVGTSLRPVLQDKAPKSRPPLHFLFAKDRAFRKGDWKLVSFRQGPWELYNLKSDRTERIDLAAKHPEKVKELADEWHNLTEKVLNAPAKECAPVLGKRPSVHPEWSKYDGKNGANTTSRRPGSPRKKRKER